MQRIESIREDEIDIVVHIHEKAFPNFFLTKLGARFLKLYYKSVLNHPDGILLGYYEDSKLVGFCAATTCSSGFHIRLIKDNLFPFALEGTLLIFTNVSALKRLYRNLTKKSSSIKDDGLYAELLSIGVLDTHQGKGIGKKMLCKLERKLLEYGNNKLSLTTDCLHNSSTLKFYTSSGYKIFYKFRAYPDREMYRMIKTI